MANIYLNAKKDLTDTNLTILYTCPANSRAIIKSLLVSKRKSYCKIFFDGNYENTSVLVICFNKFLKRPKVRIFQETIFFATKEIICCLESFQKYFSKAPLILA